MTENNDSILNRLYTPSTVFEVEGGRVGLTTCVICGAALLMDGRDAVDVLMLHTSWHNKKG